MCPIGRHGADILGLGLHNGIRDDAFGCSSLLRKLRLSAIPSVFALLLGSWFSGAATYMSIVSGALVHGDMCTSNVASMLS